MGVSYQTGTLVRTGEERATLVRRTYSLVLVSVLVTMVGASFGLSQSNLMLAVARHPFIAFFAALAPLIMATRKKTDFPYNIGLVLLFNLVMGVMISPALYFYGRQQPGLIGQAAVLTIGAFGILTLYAFVSLNLFFRNAAIDLWLASVAVLLFSGLLVFDTWRLRNFYGPDEYVGAAVQIYLDLLNMFMAILRVMGNRRN